MTWSVTDYPRTIPACPSLSDICDALWRVYHAFVNLGTWARVHRILCLVSWRRRRVLTECYLLVLGEFAKGVDVFCSTMQQVGIAS